MCVHQFISLKAVYTSVNTIILEYHGFRTIQSLKPTIRDSCRVTKRHMTGWHTHIHTRTHTYTHIRTHTQVHTRTHTHTHTTHMHTCTTHAPHTHHTHTHHTHTTNTRTTHTHITHTHLTCTWGHVGTKPAHHHNSSIHSVHVIVLFDRRQK